MDVAFLSPAHDPMLTVSDTYEGFNKEKEHVVENI